VPAVVNGQPPAVFFVSDYGTADEFVGVVHAVLHRRAPGVRVIDLSHQVPPYDVEAGASLLERSVPYLGPGVVLAVVDPGVGTGRRAVAVATGGRSTGPGPAGTLAHGGPGWLVGPDNGLLLPAADALGGAARVVELDATTSGGRPTGPTGPAGPAVAGASGHRAGATFDQRATPETGATFDGRDVFAPAAAHLATGGDPGLLGRDVDPGTLAPGGSGQRAAAGDAATPWGPSVLVAPVTWVDHFGNAQLSVAPAGLVTLGLTPGGPARVAVRRGAPPGGGPHAGSSLPARWVRSFAELGPGELGLMTDANGAVALVLDRASAARHLGIAGRGAEVEISRAEAP
jgi:S-adenosyl-L-methionine hydrolase (adenosine-forming)